MKQIKLIHKILIVLFISFLIAYTYEINNYYVNADTEVIEDNREEDSLNLIKLKQKDFSATTIPTKYDMRSTNPYGFSSHGNINISSERQVGGTCWDYAIMMVLQTTIAKSNNSSIYPLLSKAHLDYMASKYSGKKYGRTREIGTGYGFSGAVGYFKNNDGPVLNSKCFYALYNNQYHNDRVMLNGTSYYCNTDAIKTLVANLMDKLTPNYYVHEVVKFPGVNVKGPSTESTLGSKKMISTTTGKEITENEMKEIRNTVKKHIMEKGGVYCSIRTHHYFIGVNLGAPYNTYDGKYSQYDDGSVNGEIDGETVGGHGITIIGWDDNYSRTKFNARNIKGQIVHPTTNGAWLILNNSGDDALENGCQWISYEDYQVNAGLYGCMSISNSANYYTYKFTSQKAYEKMKSMVKKFGNGAISNDNTKMVKGLDIIFNDFRILSFNNNELTNSDFNMLLSNKLPQLTTFNADGNNLTNVAALSINKDTLTSISLSNNKISDVSALANLTNVKSLDLSFNNISNVSPLNLSQYDSISLARQKIGVTVGTDVIEYSYPSIFKEAKKSSSVLYSKSGLDFSGCKENSNGTGVILTSNKATIVINSGNAMETVLTITRTGNTYLLGDVDENGKINIRDIIKIRKNIANSTKWSLTNSEKTRADVNKDGKINIRDIIKIRKYIAASSSSAIAAKHPNWLW